MVAVQFILSCKEYSELPSRVDDLDCLVVRSYKIKMNDDVIK